MYTYDIHTHREGVGSRDSGITSSIDCYVMGGGRIQVEWYPQPAGKI